MRAGSAVLLASGALMAACRNFGEPMPRLAVTPPSLAFNAVAGGTAPPLQALTVDAIGGQLSWNARADVPWVSVSPASATVPTFVWVAANIAGLQAGSYAGRVTVTTTAGESMQASVPVTLTLARAVSLTGRWGGGKDKDTVTIALTIAQADTLLTGFGTLNPRFRVVSVVGSYRDPAVRLTLTASDSSVTTFDGSLVDDNTLLGVLNGGGLSNFQLTILRQ